MARYYKLIDSTGRPYITATDRRALSMMVHCGAVAAHSARKSYKIRISQNLGNILGRLQDTAGDARALSFEKKDAARMIQAIQEEQAAGLLFYEMEVKTGDRPEGLYYFFA